MDNIHKNIQEYNPNKKYKTLIAFDVMIVDMLCNKKLIAIVTELVFRGRNLNIALVFTSRSYFFVPKILETRTSTNYF